MALYDERYISTVAPSIDNKKQLIDVK